MSYSRLSSGHPLALRLGTVRILSLLALLGWPAGLLLENVADDAGLWLTIPSGLAITVLMLSRADRLFVDPEDELDEYERKQGAKALRYTYWLLAILAFVFWMWASLGTVTISDDTAEHLGFILFAWMLILPMAIQAWWLRYPFDRSEDLGTDEERS